MQLGDEIDVIKGANATNSSFLDVSRVLILAADSSPDLEVLRHPQALQGTDYRQLPNSTVQKVDKCR